MRFGWSLANANMLYLGLPVLLVVDDEYARRFWTLFEAWCSAQLVRPDGGFAAPSGRSMSAAPRQIVLAADDSGADDSCGHDDGAHYDGSVFGDVQGCKLLGPRILRAVLWIQAGQHGGLSAS